MKRSIITAALVAGALAGAAGAAVNAQEPPTAPPPQATATPTSVPVPTARERGRDERGRYDPSLMHHRVRNATYPVRVEDPNGGLPWVVKAFDADRVAVDKPAKTLKGARIITRNRCYQVGRLQGKTFGWVFGDGVFRRTAYEDRLAQCTSRKRPTATARFFTTLTIVDPAAPKLAGSVVFGFLPGAPAVTIEGTGGADGQATTRDGVFLRVSGPGARPGGQVTGGGRTEPINPPAELPPMRHFEFPTIIAGTQVAEAPAPDPAGGPRWALVVAKTREGTPCVSASARVVEDRAGGVDLELGLFEETRLTSQACRPLETRPRPELPCDVGWGYGAGYDLTDPIVEQARVQRRVQDGRSIVWAQCSEDVERVTLQTPRDVRTLVPSPVGHAILAVYDGDFVDGKLKLTAHLKSGKTWTQEHSLGF